MYLNCFSKYPALYVGLIVEECKILWIRASAKYLKSKGNKG
uniref:Uncharacterized protein n=1 Tax=Anguilla anguilla TaxID=7936 RepID=A0A0E9QZY8_ANGAN